MKWRSIILSLLVATVAAGLTHVAVSVTAAYVMSGCGRRIFNVQAFQKQDHFSALVGGYLDANPASTVTVGSSFSFGYPFPAEMTLSSGLPDTVNASVVGAGLDTINISILCEMKARSIRPRTIILEVPLINEVYNIAQRPGAAAEMP